MAVLRNRRPPSMHHGRTDPLLRIPVLSIFCRAAEARYDPPVGPTKASLIRTDTFFIIIIFCFILNDENFCPRNTAESVLTRSGRYILRADTSYKLWVRVGFTPLSHIPLEVHP